jgi:hypothetical protein
MRPIEIDFEVHKTIEMARTSFDETPNDVLRRLLSIDKAVPKKGTSDVAPSGKDWAWKDISLPHGTELRMEYNGQTYSGEIVDGSFLVEGTKVKSPSDAACTVATTKNGRKTSLNGWIYWQFKRPGERVWKYIDTLRGKRVTH